MTYFFKGRQYWKYRGTKLYDKIFPRNISSGFSGMEDNIDTAMIWEGDGNLYFFKGNWK